MCMEWKIVRLPAALHAELARLAADYEAKHTKGLMALPNEYVEGVPLHYVIAKALAEVAAHRVRSNRPRKRAARPTRCEAASTRQSDAPAMIVETGKDMYTCPARTPVTGPQPAQEAAA